MESIFGAAEYIRDGLVWDTWVNNVTRVLTEGNFKQTHCMMTINALCLTSIDQFLDFVIRLREKHPRALLMSFNILRFPSFQAIPVLPREYREGRAAHLETWLKLYGDKLEEFEREGLKRTIEYCREIEEGHSYTSSLISRQRDFKSFFTQYDERRGKKFNDAFPALADWYQSLPKTVVIKPVVLNTGDSSGMTAPFAKELEERAKEEGWVMNPQGANPGSQEYKS
jgi:hypothetical protein